MRDRTTTPLLHGLLPADDGRGRLDAGARVVEDALQRGAQQKNRRDDRHCDKGHEQAVLDGRGALLVTSLCTKHDPHVLKHDEFSQGVWF